MKRQAGAVITILILTLQWGCTDRRAPRGVPVTLSAVSNTISSALKQVADVKFQNNDTQVTSMIQKNGSLYLTGRPFGFSRWDVSVDPESPSLTFAASDQIDTFAPKGKWVVDWYASGGLGILGRYAFMSGTAGLSIIDISETTHPVERLRIPAVDPNSDQVSSDAAYQYKAIVPSPYGNTIFGFREQDYVYTLSVGNGGAQLVSRDAYGGDGALVCCVKSATVFMGKIFVAFGSRLVWFDINGGQLTNPGEFNELQAANVAATDRYLYVQHQPTYGQQQGLKNPRGYYVFDQNGDNVDYIASNDNPRQFAVSPGDSHIFMNNTDTSVTIYRIERGTTY
jgi:hypothetical protein